MAILPQLRTEGGERMSMLSAQIDELRKWADQLSERENEFGVVVRALVAALRDAADTIWQLRDDLQRANAAVQDAEHDESMAWDRVRKAETENVKLRELAEKAWKVAEMLCQAWNGPCHADGVSIMPPCPLDERDELCVYGLIQRDLRELGIEVPE